MVSVLPHSKCGMYLITSPKGSGQVLVNFVTGEEHEIMRSDDMVQNHLNYTLNFTKKSGMAFLTGGIGVSDKIWISGLGMSKVAVSHQDSGRVAVQESSDGSEYFVDDPGVMQQRQQHTVKLTSKWDLVFTSFSVERDIVTSRLGQNPHHLGGRFFGDLRCLKNTLILDDEADNLHAKEGIAWMKSMDMIPDFVEGDVGAASMIKMVRSIMIKGVEALTTEFILAAVKAGVEDSVINSLGSHFPGLDWSTFSAHLMERVATHGIRRAEEMEEVCLTIEGLGLEPMITTGTL